MRFAIALVLLLAGSVRAADDIVLADFEGDTYGAWTVWATAFGKGPAHGTLPNQMAVTGFLGKGLANSFNGGDDSKGTLTSPPFEINRAYISFLIGGGGFEGKTCINLVVNGKVVRTAVGPNTKPGGSEALEPAGWDVKELAGKTAYIQIVDNATGGWGHINIDQIVLTDARPALVKSDVEVRLTAEKRYLNIPVRHGAKQHRLTLSVDGKTDRQFTVELADDKPDFYAFIDIAPFKGKDLRVIIDKLSDASNAPKLIDQSDELKNAATLYSEALRPGFHFTSRVGWLNDPNGLVFYKGQWHLFYQHNPFGADWGNMHWGHAQSPDLFHWTESADALVPDKFGTMFSGSAVVDWDNTMGVPNGPEKPIAMLYTAAGSPFTQCLAYTTDGGKTFTKHEANPVVRNIAGDNRDPKVIWHKATGQWIMALYVPRREKDANGKDREIHTIHFLGSENLRNWRILSAIDGFFECPDLFELPVAGNPAEKHWVIYGADGAYMLGQFDGQRFTPETKKLPGHFGAHFYAAQTYSDAPDGRRVQIGWMNGPKMTGMPFNQQMAVPLELTLAKTTDGVRMVKRPVDELDKIVASTNEIAAQAVAPSANPLSDVTGDLLDIAAVIEPGSAKSVGFDLRGMRVRWSDGKLIAGGKTAPVKLENGRLTLRVLVDRASVEVFASDPALGSVYMPFVQIHKADNHAIGFFAEDGEAKIVSMKVRKLNSVWGK